MRTALPAARQPTFYAPDLEGRSAGEVLSLEAEEAYHVRALRLGDAAEITLADGRGRRWRARLRGGDGGRTLAALLEPLASRPQIPLTVAFAVANKSHTLWLVEKAVEFGVKRLQPVECARSRSVADAARSKSFWQKARRRGLGAMKQSESAWLPELSPVKFLGDYLIGVSADGPRVLLDPEGDPLWAVLVPWEGGAEAALLVGPEGGLLMGELEEAVGAGFRPASLGPSVLRFETAALAAVAVAAQRLEMLGQPEPGRAVPGAGGDQ
jgi:16S rRNA (uracil1498-N3)-methyltransferase